MAKNEIPRLIEKINLVAEAISYTAPARATEKVVKTLQAIGPRWTGLFSNSYVINAEQYGLLANGSKQEGNPTPVLFGGDPSMNSVNKVLAAGRSTFLIGNDVYYADQAADLETFRPPSNKNLDLPLKTQIFGERVDRRGLINTDLEDLTSGPNSATAPLDWFTDYAQKGGKMQKEVESTFKNVLSKIK
tara:strand:- start:264 stop:830 length:567 start_codon:yes stop_codon:yes gene_type:complete